MRTEIHGLPDRVSALAQCIGFYRMGVPPSLDRTLECVAVVDELRATFTDLPMEGTSEVLAMARQCTFPDPKSKTLASAFARAAEEVRAAQRTVLADAPA